MILKTSYTNRVVSGTRKFQYHNNGDGTYCIEDKSVYSNEGDYYGAADLNKQNYVCNKLEVDYEIVDDLIAKLATYGVTPSDNSPASIINAINSIATTYYNNGRTAGRNEVVNHPNDYGLYTSSQYQQVNNTGSDYDTRISTAINYLTGYGLNPGALGFINTGNQQVTQSYNDSVGYTRHIVAGMTGKDAKGTRSTMKQLYEAQRTVFFNAINRACAEVDNALATLSI